MFEALQAPNLQREPPWVVTGPMLYTVNFNLFHSWMQSTAVLPQHLVYPVHFLDKRKYSVDMKNLMNFAQFKDAFVVHIWNTMYWDF